VQVGRWPASVSNALSAQTMNPMRAVRACISCVPTLRVTDIPADLAMRLVAMANETDSCVADITREAIEREAARREERAAFEQRLEAVRYQGTSANA